MARRRPLTPDAEPTLTDGGGESAGGRVDEFGNEIPNFTGPNYPVPFVDYQPEEIAGSPESPRDIFGTNLPRTTGSHEVDTQGFQRAIKERITPDTFQAVAPDGSGEGGILDMLPKGVEAQGGGSGMAPMQSAEPMSVSLRGTPPAMAPSGPRRQTISSPVNLIGGGDPSGGLIGRGGGLVGGGIGMPGGPSGGPQPTAQMLALLEQLGLA